MGEFVTLTRRGDVAVVTIHNPPVNALSSGVPEAVRDAVLQAADDSDVGAVVVMGAGSTFPAGVDIREFAGATLPFDLAGIVREIEDSTKPVVMALHGSALGGGLELAMGGHYRVIAPSGVVGQPEVKLGLIPGGAGTQRLPRLAGVERALDMCVRGEPLGAHEALECGIVDRIVEGDLLDGAIAFAREVAGRPLRKTRELPVRVSPAVRAAVTAVMAVGDATFDEGCRLESEIFAECLRSNESKALIYVFFGERTVAKIPFLPKDTPVQEIRRAAVKGSGELAELANACAGAGIAIVDEADAPDIILAARPASGSSGITVGARLTGRLLEIQPGPATSDATLASAMALGKRLKKIAVHGFIAERMKKAGPDLRAMADEGHRLLAEGVALRAVDIDIACIHGFGFPRRLGGPMFVGSTSFLLSRPFLARPFSA
jgi:3-hydroxyacyl-CoA dehydrogenase